MEMPSTEWGRLEGAGGCGKSGVPVGCVELKMAGDG